MNKKKITVKELAKKLGVSISTVSKSLNDSYEISDETKRRVKEMAEKHNYKPNKLAVNLKSGKTKNIGVIIPDVLNTFFTRVLYGIERVTANEDYTIITCFSRESYEKEVANIELLSNGSIDGFIVAIAEESQVKGDFKHFEEAISHGNPIVMLDRITDTVICDKVVVDDIDNAYYATKHLIDSNCKRIALVSTIDFLSVGKLRVEGYKKALEAHSIDVDGSLIIRASLENIADEINDLLDNNSVDGIFAVDEDAALVAMKNVKLKGYAIPADISIIGYANEKIAENLTPNMTTVNQHGVTIGKAAAKLLIERLRGEMEAPVIEVIETNIVQRSSTKR